MSEPSPQPGVQHTEGRTPQTLGRQVRRRAVWDIALSIVLLLLSYSAFLIGGLFAALASGLAQDCTNCSVSSASSLLIGFGASLALVTLLGTIVTIVLQATTRRSWWVAATTFLLVAIGWIVGFLVFAVPALDWRGAAAGVGPDRGSGSPQRHPYMDFPGLTLQ